MTLLLTLFLICRYFPRYNSYRVLHSMHASYTEVCQFVSYLKPRRVVPCVVPLGDTVLTDVHGRSVIWVEGERALIWVE